jgi:hypothetical protein
LQVNTRVDDVDVNAIPGGGIVLISERELEGILVLWRSIMRDAVQTPRFICPEDVRNDEELRSR